MCASKVSKTGILVPELLENVYMWHLNCLTLEAIYTWKLQIKFPQICISPLEFASQSVVCVYLETDGSLAT